MKTTDTTNTAPLRRPREAHQQAECLNCKHHRKIDETVGECRLLSQFRSSALVRKCEYFELK